MSELVIVVPVLRRPHRVEPLLEAFRASTPGLHRMLFVCTGDDTPEQDAVVAAGAEMIVVPGARRPGDYARKINLAYRETTEPLLFLAADDLVPRPGWFESATALITDTVEVIGTNDLGNQRVMNGGHSTHTLVTRKYVDERGTIDGPGEVLHEGYNHWYVDDEFIQTAQARDAFAPCLASIVEHLHPAWDKGEQDDVYRIGERRARADRQIYTRRQKKIAAAA